MLFLKYTNVYVTTKKGSIKKGTIVGVDKRRSGHMSEWTNVGVQRRSGQT